MNRLEKSVEYKSPVMFRWATFCREILTGTEDARTLHSILPALTAVIPKANISDGVAGMRLYIGNIAAYMLLQRATPESTLLLVTELNHPVLKADPMEIQFKDGDEFHQLCISYKGVYIELPDLGNNIEEVRELSLEFRVLHEDHEVGKAILPIVVRFSE